MCLLELLSEVHIHAPPGRMLKRTFQHLWVLSSVLRLGDIKYTPKDLEDGRVYWPNCRPSGALGGLERPRKLPRARVLVNGRRTPEPLCWRIAPLESDTLQAFEWVLCRCPAQSTLGGLKEIYHCDHFSPTENGVNLPFWAVEKNTHVAPSFICIFNKGSFSCTFEFHFTGDWLHVKLTC